MKQEIQFDGNYEIFIRKICGNNELWKSKYLKFIPLLTDYNVNCIKDICKPLSKKQKHILKKYLDYKENKNPKVNYSILTLAFAATAFLNSFALLIIDNFEYQNDAMKTLYAAEPDMFRQQYIEFINEIGTIVNEFYVNIEKSILSLLTFAVMAFIIYGGLKLRECVYAAKTKIIQISLNDME